MQEIIYSNAIVRVHRPDITKEEHKRRMKQIHKAAENVLKSKQIKETQKEKQNV